MKGLGTITSSAALLQPEIVIRPLSDRAAELGVTTETLSLVTRIATSGDVDTGLAKFNLDNRQIPIRVRLNDRSRSDLERLKLLPVPGRGGPVPLMNVADVSLGSGPAQITRVDRSRNITLNANLAGLSLGDAIDEIDALPSMQSLPEGVRPLKTGDSRWIAEIFSQFALAMAIGVLSIYAVLVMLFHKFIQPVTILTALPPSAAGAIVALYLCGYSLAINSLIGLLMLMGIVSKNSILIVEYAIMAQRDHGMSRFDALIDSCSKRARPIVMTTIAMGAGMMPVAMGWAGDPSFRAPMGVAVVGGIVVSTVMSLFIVPAMFTVIDDFQQWLGRKFGSGEKHADVPAGGSRPPRPCSARPLRVAAAAAAIPDGTWRAFAVAFRRTVGRPRFHHVAQAASRRRAVGGLHRHARHRPRVSGAAAPHRAVRRRRRLARGVHLRRARGRLLVDAVPVRAARRRAVGSLRPAARDPARARGHGRQLRACSRTRRRCGCSRSGG